MFILLVRITSKSPTLAGGKEYLSLRAALGTSNSESDTSTKVSTWTNKGKVLVVERLSSRCREIVEETCL